MQLSPIQVWLLSYATQNHRLFQDLESNFNIGMSCYKTTSGSHSWDDPRVRTPNVSIQSFLTASFSFGVFCCLPSFEGNLSNFQLVELIKFFKHMKISPTVLVSSCSVIATSNSFSNLSLQKIIKSLAWVLGPFRCPRNVLGSCLEAKVQQDPLPMKVCII